MVSSSNVPIMHRKGKDKKKPTFSVIASEIGGVVGDQLKRLEKPVRTVGESVKRDPVVVGQGSAKVNYSPCCVVHHFGSAYPHKRWHTRLLPAAVRNALGQEEGDEEGGHWHSAVRKDNILTQIQGGVETLNKGIGQGAKVVAAGLARLPGGHITDMERRMVGGGRAGGATCKRTP